MTIQPAQAADTQILDQLMKELMGYEHQWDDNINPNASTAGNYAQLVDREDCRLLIAREENQVLGYLCGFLFSSPFHLHPFAVLDALYVRPDARGKGCGRALVEAFCGEARAQGAQAMDLKVLSGNRTGRAFYDKLGFVDQARYLRRTL